MSAPGSVRPARGLSLVEVIVALAIVGVGMVSIFQGLAAGRSQARRLDVSTTAHFLAVSVIEQAVDRFANRDSRYFKLNTPPVDLVLSAARGDWRAPFLALSAARRPVLSGPPNPYFDPVTGPALPTELAPDERRFYAAFSYEVRAGFTTRVERDGTPLPLDSDGDGRSEADLGCLEVEVYFTPPDGSGPERSVSKLSTLLVAPDRAPGAGALAQP